MSLWGTVMLEIRRLKEHVLTQLPPKRRQIIRLELKKADKAQITSSRFNNGVCMDKQMDELVMNCSSHQSEGSNQNSENYNCNHEKECQEKSAKQLSDQEIGLAKLSGFCEWFSNHGILRESEDANSMPLELHCRKMVIFAHHLKVLDGIQVKIAIIGITAGGVGLDFSAAENVVFLELPKSSSEMLQAEDRAHRRGQTNAVNIYIFCAKDTLDESHWLRLNRSLFYVSSLINGKADAIQEIEVDRMLRLDYSLHSSSYSNLNSRTIDGFSGDNSVKGGKDGKKLFSSTTENCGGCMAENIEEEKNKSIGTDSSECKSEKDLDLESKDYAIPHGNLEVSEYQIVRHGQSSTTSNCIVDKGAIEFDLMENFVNKAEGAHSVSNNVDNSSSEVVKSDTDCTSQVETLRFEVSQYTGRIHLYICVPGKDSRPRPLFVNFRQEDLESMTITDSDTRNETTKSLLKENPAFVKTVQSFSNEWNGLRPIQQNKLLGKPLQLPLSVELCYLKESINHGSGGLLKGGSKRRVTPLTSISRSLPENAVWKKVAVCSNISKEKEYFQAWTDTDEPLCKLCLQQCNGNLAKKPEYFEDLFCNLSCFQEYRIRTSQKALREELFHIEHGVCTQCKLDCHKLVNCLKPLPVAKRKEYVENVAPKLAKQKNLFDKLIYEPVEGNAWHADHIVPVYKGGGECSLENMRTLCVGCHAEVTKAQQTDRKLAKQRAKEQLKTALKELEDTDYMKCNRSSLDTSVRNVIGEEDVGRVADEDDLLFVEVPGSAYSRPDSC
ncbi:uncharacterized protein A4U43_C08F14100 [Asparagus officinalis]|nr:uncharacterized protein A4U43_C08F14100 [Asparagus officinalis]